MGRELKQVPLDFEWAENKVWQGWLNQVRCEAVSITRCG